MVGKYFLFCFVACLLSVSVYGMLGPLGMENLQMRDSGDSGDIDKAPKSAFIRLRNAKIHPFPNDAHFSQSGLAKKPDWFCKIAKGIIDCDAILKSSASKHLPPRQDASIKLSRRLLRRDAADIESADRKVADIVAQASRSKSSNRVPKSRITIDSGDKSIPEVFWGAKFTAGKDNSRKHKHGRIFHVGNPDYTIK